MDGSDKCAWVSERVFIWSEAILLAPCEDLEVADEPRIITLSATISRTEKASEVNC